MNIRTQCESARAAARRWARATTAEKNGALEVIAQALRVEAAAVAETNRRDLEAGAAAGLTEALLDRLRLDAARVLELASAVEKIRTLPDPVGSRGATRRSEAGLLIARQRVPLGVIAMIYEARPGVTVDAAALCLKSGNAVVLRGGKEARHTNEHLGRILRRAISEVGLAADAVQIVAPGERDEIRELVSLTGLLDLVIPRGGTGLIRFVTEHARVPVIQHYMGVCHLFLDRGCDAEMALALTLNGKVSRPGVCNALECLLVDAVDAERLLPPLGAALLDAGVELRACQRSHALLPGAHRAEESDFGAEFLAKILAVRVVDGLEGALEHIARFGSGHTEAICTDSHHRAQRFLREVDASCVLVNASTRFNDGGQLGLGAEIGISTSKLHAYGPMGLESLTSEKWVVLGEGQIRTS